MIENFTLRVGIRCYVFINSKDISIDMVRNSINS